METHHDDFLGSESIRKNIKPVEEKEIWEYI